MLKDKFFTMLIYFPAVIVFTALTWFRWPGIDYSI